MKILQIVNPVIPFPPQTVGGVERIVQYLMDELISDGHQVDLMAESNSSVPDGVGLIKIGTYLNQSATLRRIWQHIIINKYDVIHNHGRLIYFLPILKGKTRKIHTFHIGELSPEVISRFNKLHPKNLTFTPCGRWIKEKFDYLGGDWNYVNNGLPLNKYRFIKTSITEANPLVIICRIGPGKGINDAIELAKTTGKKLTIAGRIGDYPHEKLWFKENVEKYCDGEQICFIGPVNDEQKNHLLNNARALIIPTRDSEAFNTTMIEANACGCPVISYNRYCFPEFIRNGINGFTGSSFEDLRQIVDNIDKIDRAKCRKVFEDGYTSKLMMQNYLQLYAS